MSLKLTILGTNAAMPAHGRITSSQVIENEQYAYLIDCGEGTQIRLSEYKIKRNRIKAIFISHLHGDHLFGLPGVITSFFHFNRASELTIVGPVGIKEYVTTVLRLSEAHMSFPLAFIEHNALSKELLYQDSKVEVYAFPLNHRITTNGYLFKTKTRPPNLDKSKIEEFDLSITEIKQLKSSKDVHRPSGEVLMAEDFLIRNQKSVSYAYCSDTRYDESIIPYIKSVNLLYHEATYDHSLAEKAKERGHSTSLEAARIAKAAGADQLLIGHFSSKYRYPNELLEEARREYEFTDLAYDGYIRYIAT